MRSVTCAQRVGRRGARPQRLDHHGLDGEGRVLLAAELAVGPGPGDRRDQHEVDDEALVAQRPVRKIEAGHWRAPFGNAHLLVFPQPVDAGGDDDVALRQAVADR